MALIIGKATETEIEWMRAQGWVIQEPTTSLLLALQHPEANDPVQPLDRGVRIICIPMDASVFEAMRSIGEAGRQ